jgi:phage-related protein
VWSIIFYVQDNGHKPVEEFLKSLDTKTQARFLWSIEQLRLRNVMAREPLVRHLDGKLWEIREESSTNIYRILYIFFTGQRIVLLHGFQKNMQKTPRREIDTALQRLNNYTSREERKR